MQAIEKLQQQLDGFSEGLASKKDITNMVADIIKTLEEELFKRDEIIATLQSRLCSMETRLATSEHMHAAHVRQIELYSRRTSLWIEGFDVKQGQSPQNLANEVIEGITNLNVGVNSNDIDRVHRVGPVKRDENGRRKRQTVLVAYFQFPHRQITFA